MTVKKSILRTAGALLLIALLVPLAGCSAQAAASMEMPEFVADTPPRVQEMYQYAVDHPDHLDDVPCYCGCGGMGHTSNLSCFIKERTENGEVIFDNHAAGCGICVDIAQDVARLRGEGKTGLEVRAYIDATYSAFGPGTDTPLPTE
jgi:hypothetical protein